jgi:hypothetical protein
MRNLGREDGKARARRALNSRLAKVRAADQSRRIMKSPLLFLCALACAAAQAAPVSLFDGKSFDGWDGDTEKTWRIENGEIVGGSLTEKVANNEFLATKKSYANFELRLKFKLTGAEGQINAGVQIRSERIPDHFEMIGYQADLGEKYYGALYDESRRKKVLAAPEPEVIAKALKLNDWNEYRIRCEGRRIQLWINGVQTVDYTEPDEAIPQTGRIAVQIHGGGKAEARYKDIVIEELP